MNILFVSPNYHPFIGGVESNVRRVAKALASRGHRVEVVASNFIQRRPPARWVALFETALAPSAASFEDGQIQVHALSPNTTDRLRMLPIAVRGFPLVNRVAYGAALRFAYRRFRAVYLARLTGLARNADIVHAHTSGHLGWVAQEAAASVGVPFVCTPYVHPHQWGDGPDEVAHYQRASAVVGLLDSDRDYLREIGVPAAKLHVIGNAFEPTQRPGDGATFRHAHALGDAPVVLYVGRMMPPKGAPAVLAAAPLVWRQRPNARFVFVGPAFEESDLWFNGVDSRILHLGQVSSAEKDDAIAACDMLCMPSVSEILPGVYLEAWAAGKLIIGGTAPGLPALVEGSGGGVTASQDPTDIAACIIRLLSDPAARVRMGAAGRALVTSKYSIDAVASAHEALYRNVMDSC